MKNIKKINDIINNNFKKYKTYKFIANKETTNELIKKITSQSKEPITAFIDKKNTLWLGIGIYKKFKKSLNYKPLTFFLSSFSFDKELHYIPYFILKISKTIDITCYTDIPLNYFIKPLVINNTYISVDSFKQSPNYRDFKDAIKKFKKIPNLNKIVLAKTCEIKFNKEIDVQNKVSELLCTEYNSKRKKNHFFLFYTPKEIEELSIDHELSFFSYSPETLLKMNKKELITESLAGSCFNNENLLIDFKNLKENEIVSKSINNDLKPFCHKIKISKPKIKTLPYVKHIQKKISAILNEDANFLDIIHKLHPTPATLGYPKKSAYNFLIKYNNFYRSFYAGIAGVINAKNNYANIIVLLRSAELNNNKIWVYGGAGILKNSVEKEEWNESSKKMFPAISTITKNASKLIQEIENDHE
ncbi:MAG: chorismate-binding protein [Succinivibrionaceae bacterium]